MGKNSEFEVWEKEGSGVLNETPLILTACKEGQIGNAFQYPDGCIYKTVFTYLCGKPDDSFVSEHPDLIYKSRLVCMSPEWEEYVKKQTVKFILRREVMAPFCSVSSKSLKPLPEGYSISPFTRKIFEEHPFDQGRSYPDFEDFQRSGAGSAVLFDGKVVSASSSFLSFEGHVELDVYTDIEHRNKGLADHCVFEMLRECSEKKYTVHWDAQNPMSSGMAVSHGFTPVTDYAVYWLEK